MLYADQWIERDHRFCEILPNPSEVSRLSTLAEALNFYGLSRSWSRRYDKDDETRFEPLLHILDAFSTTEICRSDRTEVVKAVIAQVKPHARKELFSLATKMLWLWFKQPFIIYDGNASKALGFRKRLTDRDSVAYYTHWEAAYERALPNICDACSRLPAQHSWLKHGEKVTEPELQKLGAEPFFRERIFDVFLWSCADRKIPNAYATAA